MEENGICQQGPAHSYTPRSGLSSVPRGALQMMSQHRDLYFINEKQSCHPTGCFNLTQGSPSLRPWNSPQTPPGSRGTAALSLDLKRRPQSLRPCLVTLAYISPDAKAANHYCPKLSLSAA